MGAAMKQALTMVLIAPRPTKCAAPVTLLAAAAMLCANPAAAQEKPSPELEVAGVDKTIDMETAVPQSVIDSVNKVYLYHKQMFGVAPPIDTTFKGKPNVFYVVRPRLTSSMTTWRPQPALTCHTA